MKCVKIVGALLGFIAASTVGQLSFAEDGGSSSVGTYTTRIDGESVHYIYQEEAPHDQDSLGTLSFVAEGQREWEIPVSRYCSNGIVFCSIVLPTLVDGEESDPIRVELNWVRSSATENYVVLSQLTEKIAYFKYKSHPFSDATLGTQSQNVPVGFSDYHSLSNLFAASSNLVPPDPAGRCVDDARYQVELSVCLGRVLEETFTEHAVIFEAAKVSDSGNLLGSRELEGRLEASENAWTDYRKAHCAYIKEIWQGGSGVENAWTACMINLTKARTLFLDAARF